MEAVCRSGCAARRRGRNPRHPYRRLGHGSATKKAGNLARFPGLRWTCFHTCMVEVGTTALAPRTAQLRRTGQGRASRPMQLDRISLSQCRATRPSGLGLGTSTNLLTLVDHRPLPAARWGARCRCLPAGCGRSPSARYATARRHCRRREQDFEGKPTRRLAHPQSSDVRAAD